MDIANIIIACGYCDYSSHGHDDIIIAPGYGGYIVSMVCVDSELILT
jgi:hypothetical protein